jgi:hypothetical protein
VAFRHIPKVLQQLLLQRSIRVPSSDRVSSRVVQVRTMMQLGPLSSRVDEWGVQVHLLPRINTRTSFKLDNIDEEEVVNVPERQHRLRNTAPRLTCDRRDVLRSCLGIEEQGPHILDLIN